MDHLLRVVEDGNIIMRNASNIIIGATVRGCAFAAILPKAVIFEPGNNLGVDAVYCFSAWKNWTYCPIHPLAQDFKQILLDERALTETDKFQVGLLSGCLAKWFLKHGLSVEFMTRIIKRNGKTLTTASPAGIFEVQACDVLDATTKASQSKKLTALVSHPPAEVYSDNFSGIRISTSAFNNESYLEMEIPLETEWPEARSQFHLAWHNRPKKLSSWKLCAIGTRFLEVDYENPVKEMDEALLEAKNAL